MAFDVAKIEEKIDRTAAASLEITESVGGIRFQSMLEVMEFAKMMAISEAAVPAHLRGNPGACLAVCIQALEWRMSPFQVASKSYVVNGAIGWESQLIHAVIEQRAPIDGRLRHEFIGDGDERRCRVWATVRGDDKPFELISPPIKNITPKNSPLWKTKPDIQLYYNTSRDFCRVYFPDVLLGVYSDDELRDAAPLGAKDVTPKPSIADRLPGSGGRRGFSQEHVDRHTRGATTLDETAAASGPREVVDPKTGEITGEGEQQPEKQSEDQAAEQTANNAAGDAVAKAKTTGGEKPEAKPGETSPTTAIKDWSEKDCRAHGQKQFERGMTRKAAVPPQLKEDEQRSAWVLAGFDAAKAEKAEKETA